MKKLEKKLSELKGILGLAHKAGALIIGSDNLKGYEKKLYLLLIDNTAGKSLMREMEFLAKKRAVELLKLDSLNEILSIENCKVVGIKNKGFSDTIREKIETKTEK